MSAPATPLASAPVVAARRLIVNADDFGRSRAINRGVMRAHEQGIVTSASLMVRWPDAMEAAAYAASHPALSVGLHIDLSEWVYRDDGWQPRYEIVSPTDRYAVEAEVAQQLDRFVELTGRSPTHLDSHQHVHRTEPIRSVVLELAGTLDVPLREDGGPVRYCGDFFGQTGRGEAMSESIEVPALLAILERLPMGVTELACHPGEEVEWDSSYAAERPRELATLCDPRVRAAIDALGIQLTSFHSV